VDGGNELRVSCSNGLMNFTGHTGLACVRRCRGYLESSPGIGILHAQAAILSQANFVQLVAPEPLGDRWQALYQLLLAPCCVLFEACVSSVVLTIRRVKWISTRGS